MKKTIKFISMVLLLAAPYFSYGQYFQRLYDLDSSRDVGLDIFIQLDQKCIVFCTVVDRLTNHIELSNFHLTSNCDTILNRHVLRKSNASLYMGLSGSIRQLPGGYILPLSVDFSHDTVARCSAGLIKYNGAGDTILTKTYTDTSVFFDVMTCVDVMPNGSYIIGGNHARNVPSYYPAYLIHTDSNGNELWSHTYQKYATQEANIDNIISLPDGRIIAGAFSEYQEYISGWGNIKHNSPWFMLLDSLGNIIKDTVFGAKYMVGTAGIVGELYPDKNGGYIHIGTYDSLFTSDPTEMQNYPCYVAHLDTNFQITWITEFHYSFDSGRRQPVLVRQLRDSSYMVLGDVQAWGRNSAFAARVSRTGELLWSKEFRSDSNQDHYAYFRDMAQRADGGLVFTGTTINDSLPAWHTTQDVWLVGVDSNGCEIVNCGNPVDTITGIKNVAASGPLTVSVFPNPTYGHITVAASQSGTFTICNMLGQPVQQYTVPAGQADFQLPASLAPGIYIGKFQTLSGGLTKEIRLAYQP